ncbi:tRNA (guanosine(46)-N7)-methyltransferase TrmB [Alkalicoccus saliphilus]|jgi:tRNA (guanine-N7-)-methyltransferase|uniref:tRNA (guanine-N(7)-)-methyltransferase n=1 Tax=Alkalicoccus saliphilus TaxID=200989 RepID=A0A2T4U8S0_9BACI|nr:tRNA (guanosine(46)-N7)-methyltransferase TrmB [Alkalicoccus saliphilus]PTL39802.1 tRNA (guanosine(46)-N7)-methyltransferase TrmB [Alkalicoccus saliphilus]
MRLRNKPWAKEYIENNSHIVEQQPEKWKNKWKERFGSDHPIYVEVGSGKGKFVNELAEKYPEINVIGIELYESVIVRGVERAVEKPKPNLILLQQNVEDLTEFFGKEEIDRLFINFTDPWPKKRHAKRRLTNAGFLKKYEEVLKREAEIHFKTDNQGLFEYSLESIANYGMKLQNISLDLHQSGMEDNIMTEYEQKFSEKGMRIYRLEARLH